jgi:hypothetical protein
MKRNITRLVLLAASIATRTAAQVFKRLIHFASPSTTAAIVSTAVKVVTESGATGYMAPSVPIEALPAWKEKIKRAERSNRETVRRLLADDEQRDINAKPV